MVHAAIDLRHALYGMVKRPVFLATAVVTLALGVGASASVYALVRGLYYRAPDGVSDAARLVGISQEKGGRTISEAIQYPDYVYYRDHQTVFSELASHFWYVLADTERSGQLDAFFVSANYFPVLGVSPHLGRFFRPRVGERSGGLTSALLPKSATGTLAAPPMVLTFAGGLTLLLTAIGLYGALAVAVGQRTREIGIRMALGARPVWILRLIVREGMAVTAFGMVMGACAARALTELLSAYLYGVQKNDALTFGLAMVVLLVVAVGACALAASRAVHIDPMLALRQE